MPKLDVVYFAVGDVLLLVSFKWPREVIWFPYTVELGLRQFIEMADGGWAIFSKLQEGRCAY